MKFGECMFVFGPTELPTDMKDAETLLLNI